MRMAWGDEWTGSEWVRCTELRLWLGMLLLPPGLANHKFCKGHGKRKKVSDWGRGQAAERWSWQRSPGPSQPGADAKTLTHTSQAPPPQLQKH